MPSDLPICGYGGRTVNFVRLYSAGASDEFDMQIFNAGDYVKAVEQKMVSETISKVLYPSDSVQAGRELRLLQEYFFVACAIGDIIRGFLRRGEDDFRELPSKVAIQLNDTHPTLAIVELMRVLVDDHDLQWNMAWEITQSTFSYTNHTLMPEALERWPVSLMDGCCRAICRSFTRSTGDFWARRPWSAAKRSSAFRSSRRVTKARSGWRIWRSSAAMRSTAFRSCIRSCSRRDSLPNSTALARAFSNKTNGVTQRRWLLMANPGLAKLLDETIGTGWATELEKLRGIEHFATDAAFQDRVMAIKRANKERLATLVQRTAQVDIDPA